MVAARPPPRTGFFSRLLCLGMPELATPALVEEQVSARGWNLGGEPGTDPAFVEEQICHMCMSFVREG